MRDEVPGQTKVAVPSEEVALGITFQTGIDEKRSLVVQTYVPRDIEPAELNAMLDKIVAAHDRIDTTYRKRALQKELDVAKEMLARSMEDAATTRERWEKDWTGRGKRGAFAPDGSQKSVAAQQESMQARFRAEIIKLEAELLIAERRLKG